MPMEVARYFPVFFIALWLAVTSLLAVLSGWFSLMTRYPNRNETPILKLRWQSGAMGMGVNYNGLLTLSVCPSGIRIGMFRLFGPFCRDFFVPWEEVFVDRTESWLFGKRAKIVFGSTGSLTVFAAVIDRLAPALPERWPEKEAPAPETRREIFWRLGKLWLIVTVMASAFFIGVPRLMVPGNVGPPIAVAILFPAIVFGFSFLLQYWFQARHLPK
jgi:hypothetical protein